MPLPIDVILLKELKLFGAFGMQGQRFGTMLAMCEAGTLEPGKTVSRTVSLDQVNDVFKSMETYQTNGVVVINAF